MFGNWFKTITFREILDDFYTIIKQYDLIEERANDKIFYSLNTETDCWVFKLDCTRLEDGGLFPYRINYALSGYWAEFNGRKSWGIGLGQLSTIEGIMERKSFNWWQEERKKIAENLAQIRHDEIAMMKYAKKIELIAERKSGLTMF